MEDDHRAATQVRKVFSPDPDEVRFAKPVIKRSSTATACTEQAAAHAMQSTPAR